MIRSQTVGQPRTLKIARAAVASSRHSMCVDRNDQISTERKPGAPSRTWSRDCVQSSVCRLDVLYRTTPASRGDVEDHPLRIAVFHLVVAVRRIGRAALE